MPSLNIKNEETYRMVHDLAKLKGISMVAAVTNSVRETLEREKAERDRRHKKEGLAEVLMAIARETGPMMNDGRTSIELIEDLYDPITGLPR
jgi:hypothetical protein